MILGSAMVALILVAHHPPVDARGRLYYDPRAVERGGASTSQMGRFETELLASDDNLAALADLPGIWIDRAHRWKPPKIIVLETNSRSSHASGDAGKDTAGGEREKRLAPLVREQGIHHRPTNSPAGSRRSRLSETKPFRCLT